MKKIRDCGTQALVWRRSGEGKGGWELRAGDDVVGTVAWRNPKEDGTFAIAVSADGRWSFKRVGVFAPRVTVRLAGTETDLATVRAHMGWGAVEFTDGRIVRFIRPAFWRNEFAFTKGNGEPLLVFKENGTRVEIAPAAATTPDVSLLALLGCYLLHLYARDAEAAAIVAVLGGIVV